MPFLRWTGAYRRMLKPVFDPQIYDDQLSSLYLNRLALSLLPIHHLENALLIKQELEKIGFKIKGVDARPELESVEFLCSKCDEVANVPGFCVHDGRKRLEFSAWVEFENKEANSLGLNLRG